jgi:hypothetical protein
MCVLPSYTPLGPQINVPVATVTSGGWAQCFIEKYNGNTSLTTVLTNNCTKADLMLACRQTNSQTLTVLSWAPRGDVIFSTGTGNTPHNANGTGWYYSNSYSWGFAKLGDALSRNSCDIQNTNPALRLCWHTGGNSLNGGWRCGSTTSLNSSTTWERIVYHKN